MPQPSDLQHRRSIRLRDYDYAANGAYFVTLCTHEKTCRFGAVVDGEMQLNESGEMVRDEWLRTAEVRPQVVLDAFVIMPNHLHSIIMIDHPVGATRRVARSTPGDGDNRATHRVAPTPGPATGSLGAIIGQFKAAVTRRVNAANGVNGPLWQRNYYEHVIRNDADLEAIRDYIEANPARWAEDEYR